MALRQLVAGGAACAPSVPSSGRATLTPNAVIQQSLRSNNQSTFMDGRRTSNDYNVIENWDSDVNSDTSASRQVNGRYAPDHQDVHSSAVRGWAQELPVRFDEEFQHRLPDALSESSIYPFVSPQDVMFSPHSTSHHSRPLSNYIHSFFRSLAGNAVPDQILLTNVPLSMIEREKIKNRAGIYTRHFFPDKEEELASAQLESFLFNLDSNHPQHTHHHPPGSMSHHRSPDMLHRPPGRAMPTQQPAQDWESEYLQEAEYEDAWCDCEGTGVAHNCHRPSDHYSEHARENDIAIHHHWLNEFSNEQVVHGQPSWVDQYEDSHPETYTNWIQQYNHDSEATDYDDAWTEVQQPHHAWVQDYEDPDTQPLRDLPNRNVDAQYAQLLAKNVATALQDDPVMMNSKFISLLRDVGEGVVEMRQDGIYPVSAHPVATRTSYNNNDDDALQSAWNDATTGWVNEYVEENGIGIHDVPAGNIAANGAEWSDQLGVNDDWAHEYAVDGGEEGALSSWAAQYQHNDVSSAAQDPYICAPDNPYMHHPQPYHTGIQLFKDGNFDDAILAFQVALHRQSLVGTENAWVDDFTSSDRLEQDWVNEFSGGDNRDPLSHHSGEGAPQEFNPKFYLTSALVLKRTLHS